MTGTPPGWYPDAQGTMRWFDGTNWTEHTQDAAPPAPPVTPPAPAAPAAPPATSPVDETTVLPSTPNPTTPIPTSPYAGQSEQPAWTPMPAQPDPYAQPAPYAQAGQGGYGQGGYGQGGYGGAEHGSPQPPQKKNTGLIVGLGVLGVLLIAGIVTVAVLLVGGGDDTTTAADQTSASATGGPSTGETVPSEPTDSASVPTTTDPTDPTDPTSEPTSDSPPVTTDDSTPEGVAESFFNAIFKGDCKGASKYVSGGAALGATSGCDAVGIPSDLLDQLKLKVNKATVTGDTATVDVDLIPDIPGVDGSDLKSTLEADLSDSTGTWLITNIVPKS